MNKICKILSTIAIAVAITFLYIHISARQGVDKNFILDKPSYYVLTSYWKVFLAGIVALVFAILCSFFSWFKKHDMQDILPNAGYSDKKDISTWVTGTSLDTQTGEGNTADAYNLYNSNEAMTEFALNSRDDETEFLTEEDFADMDSDRTELLQEDTE